MSERQNATIADIACLVLRLLGIFLIVDAILSIPSVLGTHSAINSAGEGVSALLVYGGTILSFLLYLGIGWGLIVGARRIADAWFSDEELTVGVSGDEVVSIGLMLVGTWLVVTTVPQIGQLITEFGLAGGEQFAYLDTPERRIETALYFVLRIGLGVALIVGRGGFAAFWKKLRPMSAHAEHEDSA